SLPSLAAVVAFAPELTPLCTWATKQCWSWRSCLNARLGRILCCDGALRRRCIGGWHPTAALARALPLGRAPLTAPLFGAPRARAPYLDNPRPGGRVRNLRRLRIARGPVRGRGGGIPHTGSRRGRDRRADRCLRIGRTLLLRNCCRGIRHTGSRRGRDRRA